MPAFVPVTFPFSAAARSAGRRPRRALAAALALACMAGVSACADGTPTGPEASAPSAAAASLTLSANLSGTTAVGLVVTVTASDVRTPVVYNLSATNGTASGTIRVPPGLARTITVQATDAQGNVTHEGARTVDVRTGMNPPLSVPMLPLSGQVPLTASIGTYALAISGAGPDTLFQGDSRTFTATVRDALGAPVAGAHVTWASSNPGRATVDSTGRVVAMAGGPVEITASYEGVAARTALVVDPRAATDLLVMESWRATTTSLWGPEVWRTASDGSGARALTPGVVGYRPSWSPDRRRVIFARQPEPNAQFDLWSVNADGTDLRPVRLTPATSENFPKYSPDGRIIAFVASTGDRTELMVANADGTNPRVIASDASAEGGIDWTPDGTRLIYVRFDQSQRSSLVSIAPDGTNRTLLPVPWNVPQGQEFPSVSPDGREIAFAVPVPGESRNVLVMRLDGTDVRVVAGGAGLQATPTWSPDGQWIAYTNVPGEQGYLVYKVRRDGTGATPITPLPPAGVRLLDLFPQWR